MTTKKDILLVLLLLIPISTMAQLKPANYYQNIELYAGMGTTHYFGEIGGSSNSFVGLAAGLDNLGIDPLQTRLGWAIGGRFSFRKNMAVRVGVNALWINGNDHNSKNSRRGYYFDALSFEGEVAYEYYFAQRMTGFAPYGTIGLAGSVYRFKVKENNWGDIYTSPVYIIGIGTRLPSRNKYTHSFELGFHYMATDFLDGMNGTRNSGDTYYFIRYAFNFELDRTFVFDHKGLIR